MNTRDLSNSVRATLVTFVALGLLYPALATGTSLLLFPRAARGSLVSAASGQPLGSALIAQPFTAAGYLQPRPSAVGWDAAASGGSNLGPTSRALRARVEKELQRLLAENPDAPRPVPAELVTASASGLDPHLSPDGAFWQVPRIAAARHVEESRVRAVIEANLEGRDLWVLGEPRVNVLLINLALDRHFGRTVVSR